MRSLVAVSCALLLLAACSERVPKEATPAGPDAAGATSAGRDHLEAMRAQFAIVEMRPDVSFLTNDEARVVNLLNKAALLMSEIYLRQISEDNPAVRAEIAASGHPDREILLNLFDLHFGPWDSLDEDRPFYGTKVKPPGGAFYPADMGKEEFEAWIDAHPGDREAFTSGYTVIRRDAAGGLKAIPYSVHYREWLEPAADLLRKAAAITDNASLKHFLSLRADAFLSDDYLESEMAWMDLQGPIEVAIGPYEVYSDGLFGYKTAFEAFVTVKNPQESAKLDKYKRYLPEMEEHLPVPPDYKNFRRKFESPIAVVAQVHGGGDNVPGVQTIAFNLPNDERVREAKGAKKVLLNNVMAAKFDRIVAPMAGRVLVPEQASMLMREYMAATTLFHELSHSLGPGTITKNGAETTVSAELKDLYAATEEGKADVMGVYNILFMMQKGELPAEEKQNVLAVYLVEIFRHMRFGLGEAHAKGGAFQYAYLKERGAFAVDAATGKLRIDFPKLEAAIETLTAEIVMLQGDADYDRTKAFLDRYPLDRDAEKIIATLGDIPVDIDPDYPSRV